MEEGTSETMCAFEVFKNFPCEYISNNFIYLIYNINFSL